MAAVHEDLTRPQVLAALEDLMTRNASGVFEVAGNPFGAIYLDGGHIVFARASWVPGLAVRLRAICPALAASSGRDGDDVALAGLAVRRGYLTTTELEEVLRSIVVDVFLVLTVALAADSRVGAIRFTSTRTHWTNTFTRHSLDSVREEALMRGRKMADCDLSPTTGVALRDLAAPVAVLTRQQWLVACQIGDQASARDLAIRCGGALSDTVENLANLIRLGVCAPVPADADRPEGAEPGGPSPESVPAQRLPARPPVPGLPPRSASVLQPPPIDLLHQVLSGLRKLD